MLLVTAQSHAQHPISNSNSNPTHLWLSPTYNLNKLQTTLLCPKCPLSHIHHHNTTHNNTSSSSSSSSSSSLSLLKIHLMHHPTNSIPQPTLSPKCPIPHTHKPSSSSSSLSLLSPPKSSSPSSSSSSSSISDDTAAAPSTLRYVNDAVSDSYNSNGGGGGEWVPSASAVASAIRKASSSPIEFVHRIERDPHGQGLVMPSPDFQRLCLDQLALFQRIVHPNVLLSVYVRPAGSYVMDRLELRRVAYYPNVNGSEVVILVGNFSIPTGLRGAETALSNQQVEAIPECRAMVFPMVKHPFVVGFLVAELSNVDVREDPDDDASSQLPSPEDCYALPPLTFDFKSPGISGNQLRHFNLSTDQKLNAINISRSLAMAYVMDQKAMLLQQTSWQNNIRMNNLVEQIRGPLSSIRTLTKMLSVQLKRNEIAHDIVEDIMIQSDHMHDTLQQLQDAVHLTKANIMRFNEESLKRLDGTNNYGQSEIRRLELPNNNDTSTTATKQKKSISIDSGRSIPQSMQDLEMPMPPLALVPLQQHKNIRPCNVSDVLVDLIGAVEPLAQKQKRSVKLKLSEFSQEALQVCVEEPALRQALGNLIEGALLRTHVGGNVEIVSVGAPAGGALVLIDDDGPDMHFMTQMHSLAPFGAELFAEQMVEDNMTWNFVAGLTVAREILESYGCVVRVISPRNADAALGAGGTRIEVWLPSSASYSHTNSGAPQDA